MKTRILTLFILLFAALTALSGNKMDNLFDQVKSLPYANYIHQKLDKSKSKGQGAIEGIKFWVKVYENCSPAETINYTVNDHATLYYQGITAFDFNSGFMIDGVRNNRPDLLPEVSCAMLPRMNEDDPLYSAEATHIPLVIWENSEHPEICEAFIEYLYEESNYIDFLSAVPVGMLPAISGISETEAYRSNEIVQQFAEEEAVIAQAVDMGRAIGFEHGPSAQAGLLANQGIIEEMFQDIITNGTDVETAAQAAEDRLNEIFDTDEGPREGQTIEKLARLRPCFVKDGTVTAGNSSSLNDGAAAVVVMSREKAEELGVAPKLKIEGYTVAGFDAELMGYSPKFSSEQRTAS